MIKLGGCPPRRRGFVPLRLVILGMGYIFAVALLFLSPKEQVTSNRLWALLILVIGGIFFDYCDIDLERVRHVRIVKKIWIGSRLRRPKYFPIRWYALGVLYGICLIVLIIGAHIPDQQWGVAMLLQFIILLSYSADDR